MGSTLILIPIAWDLADDVSFSVEFWVFTVVSFAIITVAHLPTYGLFGERVLVRANLWVNTLIFVGPAFVVGWWNAVAPEAARSPGHSSE